MNIIFLIVFLLFKFQLSAQESLISSTLNERNIVQITQYELYNAITKKERLVLANNRIVDNPEFVLKKTQIQHKHKIIGLYNEEPLKILVMYFEKASRCIAIPINKPLIKDSLYLFETKLTVSDYLFQHRPKAVSILFESELPDFKALTYNGRTVGLFIDRYSFLLKKENGESITAEKEEAFKHLYKATGDEKFIILGMVQGINEFPVTDTTNVAKTALETTGLLAFSKIKLTHYDYTQMPKSQLPEVSTFDYGKSILKPEAYTALDEWVRRLNETPTMQIKITGFTDNQGSEELNLKLSKARALAVGQYLNSKGIERNRISLEGLGNQNPIESNDTEQGRVKNRRVEIEIVNP